MAPTGKNTRTRMEMYCRGRHMKILHGKVSFKRQFKHDFYLLLPFLLSNVEYIVDSRVYKNNQLPIN